VDRLEAVTCSWLRSWIAWAGAQCTFEAPSKLWLLKVFGFTGWLGGVDLTIPAGKMTMSVIAAVVEAERDLLIERTQAGLKRAKATGKALGRPSSLSAEQQAIIRRRRSEGISLGVLAMEYGVSRAAIQRVEKRADALDLRLAHYHPSIRSQ
jgi:hypothetical protein